MLRVPVPHPHTPRPGFCHLCLLGRLVQENHPSGHRKPHLELDGLKPQNLILWRLHDLCLCFTCHCWSCPRGEPRDVPCPPVGQGVPQPLGTTQIHPVLSSGQEEPAAAPQTDVGITSCSGLLPETLKGLVVLIFQEMSFKGNCRSTQLNNPSAQSSGAGKSSAERMVLFTFCVGFVLW